jgi:hypothetical protein
MFDFADFSEPRGRFRGTFLTYKRNSRGGVDLTLTVDDDDKHSAIDMVDGGDIVVLFTVAGIPRDEDGLDDE